jgi:hypothetical protein
MDAPDLFKTAPREVTRYFDGKPAAKSFDWRDWAPEDHAQAFTVAKSTGYDIIDDIRAAMADAIANRIPEREFIANLMPTLQAKGWWGKAMGVDPATGEERVVQLGSPRRLRTIYWANVRTAHAAGEWERTQRTKRFLPYLIYLRSMAEKKREEHLRYVGLIAPVDDPIWRRLYPPNGWGCQCGVRQISRTQAEGYGWREGQPTPEIVERPWRNKRTGETVMLPEGVDPGWDTNPGEQRAANLARYLTDKVEAMPAARQEIAIRDLVSSPILKAYAEGRLKHGTLPIARLPAGLARAGTSSIVQVTPDVASRISLDEMRAALVLMGDPQAVTLPRGDGKADVVGASADTWWRIGITLGGKGAEWFLSSILRLSAEEASGLIGS